MFLIPNRFVNSDTKHNMLILLIVTGMLFCYRPVAANKPSTCDQNTDVIEVQSGLFVRPGSPGIIFEDKNIANIGFIVGDEAIAVIDTGGSIHEGEQLLCQIRKISQLPIRYLINTHVHPDHTMGNSAFTDPAITFIGHKNLTHAIAVLGKTYLRRYNAKSAENVSDESIIFPQIQVTDELEIDLGNRPITVMATPRAHTNNDLLVHDKKTQTLWLSDLLFHNHIPVIGKSGSVNGWLQFIKKLNTATIKTVIPGHGPLNMDWNKSIKSQNRYLTLMRDEIRSNISTNADLATAMETIGLSESSKWKMFSSYHKRNISYIFSELEWE